MGDFGVEIKKLKCMRLSLIIDNVFPFSPSKAILIGAFSNNRHNVATNTNMYSITLPA